MGKSSGVVVHYHSPSAQIIGQLNSATSGSQSAASYQLSQVRLDLILDSQPSDGLESRHGTLITPE